MVQNNNHFEDDGQGDGHIICFVKIWQKVPQWIQDWVLSPETALELGVNPQVSNSQNFDFGPIPSNLQTILYNHWTWYIEQSKSRNSHIAFSNILLMNHHQSLN